MPFTDYKHMPHPAVVKALVEKNFPLNANPVFNHNPIFLAQTEYARIDDLLKRKLVAMYNQDNISYLEIFRKYQQLSSMIIKRERQMKEQLEDLAIKIITTIFSPPEHIDLKAMINSRMKMDIDPEQQKPSVLPDMSPERLAYLNAQVQKRVLLNGLVQGSAMHIWKSSHYMVKEEIDKLSPALMSLYDEYISLTSLSLWQLDISLAMKEIQKGNEMGLNTQGYMTQGQCKLNFGEGGVEIEIKAVNFPVMLHELTKGILDYLICHAIPEDLDEAELDYYYAKADDYSHEMWHYILSPTIWETFVQAADCDTQDLAKVVHAACQMEPEELYKEFKTLIDDRASN